MVTKNTRSIGQLPSAFVSDGPGLTRPPQLFVAAGVVVGGKVPVVITSRSDDAPTRLASMAAVLSL